MRTLNLFNVEEVDELAWPDNYQAINLDSSALLVFTDFKKHKPLVIDGDLKAHEAEQLMMNSHVRLKIVLDENGHFIGVVSLLDISHREIVKKVARGYAHDDLQVIDFMQTKASLNAIDYAELKTSSVGDILQTLKANGESHHCLVIDKEQHNIRGVISTSDLVRRLKLHIDLSLPPSFVDIFNLIHS